MKKVLVVTDRVEGQPRRGCYWTREFLSEVGREPQAVSIVEEISAGRNPATKLFAGDHDEIVVNWDAINGDPVYHSDIAQTFFRHYQPDLFRWLRRGRLLLVESQRGAEIAVREAYASVSPLAVPSVSPGDFQGCDVWVDRGKTFSVCGSPREDLFTPSGPLTSVQDRMSISGQLYQGCFSQGNPFWVVKTAWFNTAPTFASATANTPKRERAV